MKKILIIFLLFVAVGTLSAQNTYFTDSLYLEQLNTFLSGTYKIHPEVEAEYDTLVLNWESGKLNNQKFGIEYVSNSLKDAHAKPYPQFYNYISTLNALIKRNDINYYSEWEVGLLSVTMTNKLGNISDYLKLSYVLIKDSILVQTPSVTWKVNSTDYSIDNDPNTETVFITFNSDFNLTCTNTAGNFKDQYTIEKTVGTCYPLQKKFIGKYGKVTWAQVKFDEDKVYAEFDDYTLDMKQKKIVVDTAYFTDEFLNFSGIPGKFEATLNQSANQSNSPTFETFQRLNITDFFTDVEFMGNIKIKGDNVFGEGTNQPAIINIYTKGKIQSTLISNSFKIIPDSLIFSMNTDVSFYFNSLKDSISHFNLMIRYQNKVSEDLYNPTWFNYDSNSTGPYLTMVRGGSNATSSPFGDSYHKIDIYTERAIWQKDDSLVFFFTTDNSTIKKGYFQSQNLFDENEYNQFSGITTSDVNHLSAIRNLRDGQDLDCITVGQYQTYLKNTFGKQLDRRTIQNLFTKLSYANFVKFNRSQQCIITLPKLDTYLANSARKRLKKEQFEDFDDLYFISDTLDYINAKLNLTNNTLKINNIIPFRVSPKISIYTNEITLQQNRDFLFGGQVKAGLSLYEGNKFNFKYDDYKILILDTNSTANFAVIDTLNHTKIINTTIENLGGEIAINKANNKSNTLANTDQYPILTTNKKTKVHYSNFASKYGYEGQDSLFNSKFNFEADEFVLDSLSYLRDTSLAFSGKMKTGLFKPLRVDLTVKKALGGNLQLGFTKCTDEDQNLTDGLEFKDGKFFGCFELNDEGLFGYGYILYASSYVSSENFAFLPDEVEGTVDSVVINNQVYSPSFQEDIPFVTGNDTYFDWKNDMSFTSTRNSHLIIYSDKLNTPGDLDGTLYYKQDSMMGKGTFQFLDADIVDTNFTFKSANFTMKTCDFNLKVGNATTFKTHNLNGNVDIDREMGTFFSNDDTTAIVFADNRYICYMDHFLWKIGEGIVNIGGVMPGQDTTDYATDYDDLIAKKKNNKDIKLFGTLLTGMNDSIHFHAATTTYQIQKTLIVADNVQEIKIADAMIYPNGQVKIKKFGQIDTLHHIAFDFPYKIYDKAKKDDYLYSMHDATVFIENRFNYTAFYPKYYYPFNSQLVVFDNIQVQNAPAGLKIKKNKQYPDIMSTGYKKVIISDTLALDNNFTYTGSGNMKIFANNEHIQFDGYAKIHSSCNNRLMPVLPFKVTEQFINPDTVTLPMSYKYKSDHGNVYSGLYWGYKRINNKVSNVISFPFIGKLDDAASLGQPAARVWAIMKPSGFIGYNVNNGEYRIGDTSVINSNQPDTIRKNMFAYNRTLCLVKAQGEFNMFMPWDMSSNRKEVDHIKSIFRGFYRNDLSNNQQQFQGTWALDFIAPNIITNSLANNCLDNFNNVSTFDQSTVHRIRKNYTMFLGKTAADKIITDMETNFDYNLPDSLKIHTIVFSDVKMIFTPDSAGLVSDGDIGIASINGKKIDRYVKGYIKYRVNKKTRMLIIILEPSPGLMYGFKYRFDGTGVMAIYSNSGSEAIDNYISGMKDKDRKTKNYEIISAEEDDFKSFAGEYFK